LTKLTDRYKKVAISSHIKDILEQHQRPKASSFFFFSSLVTIFQAVSQELLCMGHR